MTTQRIAIGLVAIALFVGSMTAHGADFSAGVKAYDRGDYATALRIFRQLADQGLAAAQNNLGSMHLTGHGVPRDYEEAVKWYRKAAERGLVLAQINLGTMYLTGHGVTRNYKEAMRWSLKAAEQGYAKAQIYLGTMYHFGQGVPQDYVLAHMWMNIAAMQGNATAKKGRDLIATIMNAEQIAEAQKLAREWKPKGK